MFIFKCCLALFLVHAAEATSHLISKGYVIIINNQKFENLDDRVGSDFDVQCIKSFCNNYGMKISVMENLTASEMVTLCSEVSKVDYFYIILKTITVNNEAI